MTSSFISRWVQQPAFSRLALTTIQIPNEPVPWPTNTLRRASVSSFGFGGSNSHVVLDDAYNFLRMRGLLGNHSTVVHPQSPSSDQFQYIDHPRQEDNPKLLVWSSADEKGISRIQESWKSFLSAASVPENKTQYINDLSYTLGSRRTHFPWRSFVVARSSDDWSALPDRFASAARSLTSPNLALVFSGVSYTACIHSSLEEILIIHSKALSGMQWAVSCSTHIPFSMKV